MHAINESVGNIARAWPAGFCHPPAQAKDRAFSSSVCTLDALQILLEVSGPVLAGPTILAPLGYKNLEDRQQLKQNKNAGRFRCRQTLDRIAPDQNLLFRQDE